MHAFNLTNVFTNVEAYLAGIGLGNMQAFNLTDALANVEAYLAAIGLPTSTVSQLALGSGLAVLGALLVRHLTSPLSRYPGPFLASK
jgi:hypothetical protein